VGGGSRVGLPISFHIGSGDMAEGLLKNRVATYGKMAAFAELAVDIFLRNGLQLNDLMRVIAWPKSTRNSFRIRPRSTATKYYKVTGPSAADEAKRAAAIGP